MVGIGTARAELLRWAALTDMFGYYLLPAPMMIYMHTGLRERGPFLADLSTFAGLAYAVIGAAGAVMLAATAPGLINEYATTADSGVVDLVLLFETAANVVFRGLWQTLALIFLGVWGLGIGRLLKNESQKLGDLLRLTGLLSLLASLGRITGFELMTEAAGAPVLGLLPLAFLLLAIRAMSVRGLGRMS